MAELKNEFSWSKSRARIFDECHRRYWFHYYGAWGGWDVDNTSPETREIYILKQLKNRWMWAGELVHWGVELVLKDLQGTQAGLPAGQAGIPLSPDRKGIQERILAEMRKDFVRSRNGTYRIEPKTGGLIEHEYKLDLTDEDWQKVKNHIMTCLENFFDSEILKELKQLPQEQWLPVERVSAFEFEGTKVYVKPDVLHRTEDGDVQIIDWKTSREDRKESLSGDFQLPTYFLYVIEKGLGEPEKVRAMEANLSTGTIREEIFDPEKIERIKREIRENINEMKRMLVDPERNIARKEDFNVATDSKVCRYCNFQKVCEDRPGEEGN